MQVVMAEILSGIIEHAWVCHRRIIHFPDINCVLLQWGAKRGGRRKRIKIPNMSSNDIGLDAFEFQRILFVFQECSGWDKLFLASCFCISSTLLLPCCCLTLYLCRTATSAAAACFPFWFVQRWQVMLKHARLCVQEDMLHLVGHYRLATQDRLLKQHSFLWGNIFSVIFSFKDYFICCTYFGIKLLIL